MSESTIQRALRDAVSDVLGKMFFIQPLGESLCPASGRPNEIAARVEFQGEPDGSLTIYLSSRAARQIAADFLGTDEADVSNHRVDEVVCEMANMICGSMLSRVESTATFQLSGPRIVPPLENDPAGPDTTRYAVDLSNGALAVNVTTGTAT